MLCKIEPGKNPQKTCVGKYHGKGFSPVNPRTTSPSTTTAAAQQANKVSSPEGRQGAVTQLPTASTGSGKKEQ